MRLQAGSVQDGECRIWQRALTAKGYGKIGIGRRVVLAHRAAYEVAHGPIPDGVMILHRCDRPACIAVGHLFPGNNSANMRDMSHKFRGRDQKLSTAARAEIRAAYAAGTLTQRALAAQYGVAQSLISRVVNS